jgi:hypothetical protein
MLGSGSNSALKCQSAEVVVRKRFRIRIRTFVKSSHRIHNFFFAFCIRIALHRIFFTSSLYLHLICRSLFTAVDAPKVVKSARKKCEKCAKNYKNLQKFEKVQNANAMRKRNQNSHRITLM